jgi:hypothetical protein
LNEVSFVPPPSSNSKLSVVDRGEASHDTSRCSARVYACISHLEKTQRRDIFRGPA